MTRYRLSIVGLGLAGAIATHYLTYRFLPLSMIFRWDGWESSWAEGAIAGALAGHLAWVAANLRRRLSRASIVCVAGNIVAWTLFLVWTPPVSPQELEEIHIERAGRDAGGGMDLVTHRPVVVAGRWHATFYIRDPADRLLALSAGPAIAFVDRLVTPPRYIGSAATRGESFVTAAFGFVLSTAFWTAFGGWLSALLKLFEVWKTGRTEAMSVHRGSGVSGGS